MTKEELIEAFYSESKRLIDNIDDAIEIIQNSLNKDNLSNLYRYIHTIKSVARTAGMNKLSAIIHDIENYIAIIRDNAARVKDQVDDICKFFFIFNNVLDDSVEYFIIHRHENISLLDKIHLRNLLAALPTDLVALVKDRSDNSANAGDIEWVDEEDNYKDSNVDISLINKTVPEKLKESKSLETNNIVKGLSTEDITIPLKTVDQVIRLVGELTIQADIIYHHISALKHQNKMLTDSILLLNKGLSDVQSLALALRMQNFEKALKKVKRTAFDTAKKLNKEITIDIIGAEVGAEKTIIEKLQDVLIHLINNSIDHGIEEKSVRIANSKNQFGNIKITIETTADGLIIDITDDGRGIDKDKILQKAKQMHLISSSEPYNEQEIFNRIIFSAGLSSKDRATEISGRGVGLDYVKTTIEQLSGRISVNSISGKGTSFKLFVPPSLSIIESIIVKVDKSNYAIPLNQVNEIVILEKKDIYLCDNAKIVFELRGAIIPIAYMGDVLSRQHRQFNEQSLKDFSNSSIWAILTKNDTMCASFIVDEVVVKQSIIMREINQKLIDHAHIYSGTTILGDGCPILIINLEKLLSSSYVSDNASCERFIS